MISTAPGDVLLERWQIVRPLGRGGFGAVFETLDLRRGETRAVKILDPKMLAQEEFLARFRREFELMRQLDHPGVVRVDEYREDPDERLALISMEYVAGGTVSDLVTLARREEQPVPLLLALRIAAQTLEALVAAHRQGVLHRDVTPRNVLLAGGPAAELFAAPDRDPRVKLVDFGIAGLVRPSAFSQTSRSLGTIGYVAPEMLAPAPQVTAAADVYGVGAVTYELVTGELPVGVFEAPSKLRAGLRAEVAAPLDALFLDLLRRRPEERPDAPAALTAFRAIEQKKREREPHAGEEPPRRKAVAERPKPPAARPRRRFAAIRYGAGALVVIALVTLTWYLALRDGGPAPGPGVGTEEAPSQAEPRSPPAEDPGGPAAEADSGAPAAEDSAADCPRKEQEEEYGMVMVRICGGTFTMGSADGDRLADDDEHPAHQVTVSEFWIGKTEVTNEQYRQVHPDHRPNEPGNLPATYVSWHDAKDFCERGGYHLPTEAEWEYAARAGTQTPWSFGAKEDDIRRFAWYAGNSERKAQPVATRESNPWGLYDMHGNVWEWVADAYARYSAEPQTDPEELGTPGAWRVVRGGSCWGGPRWLRSANRYRDVPGVRSEGLGFRCVRRPRRQP